MRLIIIAAISFMTLSVCWGQGSAGGVSGHILDSSGAAIADASIRVGNLETGVTNTIRSTADGNFLVNGLNPGTYQLTVSKEGFATAIVKPVAVSIATTASVDVTLQLGRTNTTVQVSASAEQLNTDNAEIGTVMPPQQILDLPISLGGTSTIGASGRRQIENFTFLTPGVTGNQWSKNINGAPGFSQEILYDGQDAQSLGAPGFIAESSPPYEAIEEFKVQNTLYPAEYGFGFGVENFTFRSGTNQFHGDLFDFLRNDKLDAAGFYHTKSPLRQNEFGVTFGGPLIIPRFYHGRNKTFFFLSYDGFRLAGGLPATGPVTIPSLKERTGDFSDYPYPIFDPNTTQLGPNGQYLRDAFPGNIIPADRISAVAKRLNALLPAPDLPGYNNNYLNRQNQPTTEDSGSARFDHSITDNNRLSGSFWWVKGLTTINGPLAGNPLDYTNRVTETNGGGVRVNYDTILSPTLLNHAGFGWTPVSPTWSNWLPDSRKGNATLQIPGISPNAPGYPQFTITGYQELGNSNNQGIPIKFQDWSFRDDVSWTRGKHQLRFGLEYRHRNMRFADLRNQAGSLNFSNLSTSNPSDPNFNTYGNGYASLLLGQVDSGSVFTPEGYQTFGDTFWAFFAEDGLKINPKLTVTLGLRYELPFYPQAGAGGNLSRLNLTETNPAAGGIPGALEFSGQGGNGTFNVLYKNPRNDWSPRIGVAYQVDPKTVLRAGAGFFYLYPNYGRLNQGSLWGNGFGYTQSLASTNQDVTPAFLLDNGFPPANITLPDTNPSLLNGGTASYINRDAWKPATQYSWTFDLQRNLPFGINADIAYVGSRTVNLETGFENVNQVNPQYLSLGSTLNADINSAAKAAGIAAPFPGFSGSVAQALRPYPQYTTIYDIWQPIGWSTYQALQARVQKRFSDNLTFLLSYTFSKTLGLIVGDTFGDPFGGGGQGSLNTYDRNAEKAISPYDQTHVTVLSWTYELPFGRGQRFGSNVGPLLNQIISGWQINAVQTYSSGTPLTFTGGTPLPIFNGVGNRPDVVPGQNLLTGISAFGSNWDPTKDRYLNLAAFAQPAPFTFGNASPRYATARHPFYYDEDLSFFKKFPIRERSYLEFRAEMFNICNRVVFGSPNTNTSDPKNFGTMLGISNTPRVIQGALKFIF